jgi:hypothetical protein
MTKKRTAQIRAPSISDIFQKGRVEIGHIPVIINNKISIYILNLMFIVTL